MSGRLIVVEGLDGVGKSTLVGALSDALGALRLRTPGDGVRDARCVIDNAWQGAPVATQLFYAASVTAASDEARVAIDRGQDVVIDRYWASTMVYAQRRTGWVRLSEVESRLLPATVTLWVDLPEPIRVSRLLARGALTAADQLTLERGEGEALRRSYGEWLCRSVHGRCVTLDGMRDPVGLLDAALVALAPL